MLSRPSTVLLDKALPTPKACFSKNVPSTHVSFSLDSLMRRQERSCLPFANIGISALCLSRCFSLELLLGVSLLLLPSHH